MPKGTPTTYFNNERCPKCNRMCRGSAKGWHCDVCNFVFTNMEENKVYNLSEIEKVLK